MATIGDGDYDFEYTYPRHSASDGPFHLPVARKTRQKRTV